MNKTLHIVLVAGFIIVDFLIFHDFFKAGEVYTFTEYLTGLLSLIVIVTSLQSLVKR